MGKRNGKIHGRAGVKSGSPHRPPETWPEILADFKASHIDRNQLTERSRQLGYARTKALTDWLAEDGIEPGGEIEARCIDRYLQDCAALEGRRGSATLRLSTLNGYGRCARTFLKFCVGRGYVSKFPPFVMPRNPEPETDYLTEEEQATMLALVGNERDDAFLRLALATGARLGEMIGGDWRNLAFSDGAGALYIAKRNAKGGKARTVDFLSDTWDVEAAVRRYEEAWFPGGARDSEPIFIASDKDDGPMTLPSRPFRRLHPHGINHLCERLSAQMDRRVFPHLFRHTAFTNYARLGVSAQALMHMGGWSTLRMVERYTRLAGSDVRHILRAKVGGHAWGENGNGRHHGN